MQGSSQTRTNRIGVSVAFVLAFLAGAVVMFALFGFAGSLLGLREMPLRLQAVIIGIGLLAFILVDVSSIRRGTYCPIGFRRQTPRSLLYHCPPLAVVTIWGFDTGCVITTFRVAAVTWGALLMVTLGLAPIWSGLAYGLGFAAPVFILLWRHWVGVAARSNTPADPGLESLLGKRRYIQYSSAMTLALGGWSLAMVW